MVYADLTAEESAILDNFIGLLRSWAGEQARVNNHAHAISTAYSAQVTTILGKVGGAEVIPNASGLDGSASLTGDEVVTLVSHVLNILTDMSSHVAGFDTAPLRQTWSKAAGARNLIG